MNRIWNICARMPRISMSLLCIMKRRLILLPIPVNRPAFFVPGNRRKALFTLAKDLGCNKIALGHHMDDILETRYEYDFSRSFQYDASTFGDA